MIEISGYKIKKTLGQGGMSTVYLAVQKSVDRYVALKVMSPDLVQDETSTQRFLREARIAARFRHDNIISILDVSVADGVPYIAMEYVPGGALDTERIKSMSLTEKLSVIVQIADALGFLHKQNFVHRDIKPSNILFREDDTAVLTDFGIASDQSLDIRMTKTGYIMGTPHYMSPEQAMGGDLDARADLYSMGVMLFRVLTGRVPFAADDAIAVCTMHVSAEVPDLPDDLAMFDPIVKKAMAKAPEDRYSTANEFIDELLSVTGSETARLLRRSLSGVALEATADGDEESSDSVVERFSAYHGETRIQPSFGTGHLKRDASLEEGFSAPDDSRRRSKRKRSTSRTTGWRVLGWLAAVVIVLIALVIGYQFVDMKKMEAQLATAERWLQTGDLELAQLKYNDVLLKHPGNEVALDGLRRISELEGGAGGADAQADVPETDVPLSDDSPVQADETEVVVQTPQQADPAELAVEYPDSAEDAQAVEDLPEQFDDAEIVVEITEQSVEAGLPPEMAEQAESVQAPVETPEPVETSPYADEIEMLLERSREHVQSGQIVVGEGSPSADLRRVLELDPDNSAARQDLDSLSNLLLGRAYEYLNAGELESARWMLDESELTQSGDAQWRASLRQTYTEAVDSTSRQSTEINELLALGNQYLQSNKLTRPADANAVMQFRKVLELDPGNAEASEGLKQVGVRYLELAADRIRNDDWAKAEEYWQRSNEFAPGLARAAEIRQQLDERPSFPAQQAQTNWPQTAQPAASSSRSNLPPKEIGGYRLPPLNLSGSESADTLYRMGEESKTGGDDMRAYALYKEALKRDPGFARAEDRLNSGAQSYIARANRDIGNKELFLAHENLSIALTLDSSHRDLEKARRAYLTARDQMLGSPQGGSVSVDSHATLKVNTLVGEAEDFLARFVSSNNTNRFAAENAKRKYLEALAVQADNQAVRNGMIKLSSELVTASHRALDQNRVEDAQFFYQMALEVRPSNPELTALEERLNQ